MEVPINDDDLQEKDECFRVDFSVLDGPLSISKSSFGPTQLKINVIENDGVSIYCAVCVWCTPTLWRVCCMTTLQCTACGVRNIFCQ